MICKFLNSLQTEVVIQYLLLIGIIVSQELNPREFYSALSLKLQSSTAGSHPKGIF